MDFINDFLGFRIGSLTVQDLFSAVFIAIICVVITKLALRLIKRGFSRTTLAENLQTLLLTIIRVLLYTLVTLVVADSLGIPVTSLLAVLSVAGLAVSLAIQDTLANVFAGILLLASKTFETGNYVQIAGMEGTVIDVALMNTHLRTGDNKIVRIPNKDVQAAAIINFSHEPTRRVELKVTVSYDAPTEDVKAALLKAVTSIDVILKDPAPFAGLNNFLNSSIEYIVRGWANSGDYWTAYFALTENVRAAFAEAGIEMTYDHINVHMIEK